MLAHASAIEPTIPVRVTPFMLRRFDAHHAAWRRSSRIVSHCAIVTLTASPKFLALALPYLNTAGSDWDSPYPALYRLEGRGWVEAEWGTSELGRRAKLYRLTPKGRERLAAETAQWRRFSAGVSKLLLAR
jgi:hypothetical protein